jgi:hypothetical protein
MSLQRLTGTQVLRVIPATVGTEAQSGDYTATDIDADYSANLAASMTGRAYQWTYDAVVAAGINPLLLTSAQQVSIDRVMAYRVILDCLSNSRLAQKFKKNACEPIEIYEEKRRAIMEMLCEEVSNLGISDPINCFALSDYIGASRVECNCN